MPHGRFPTAHRRLDIHGGAVNLGRCRRPGWALPFANVSALIVSQTVETHNEIAAYFRTLRELAAAGK